MCVQFFSGMTKNTSNNKSCVVKNSEKSALQLTSISV